MTKFILTKDAIERALSNLAATDSVKKYLWIQARVREKDFKVDRDFERKYNHFYRIRQRSAQWYRSFYDCLMDSRSEGDATFETILLALQESTGRLEASFASKIAATINADIPVLDSEVLKQLSLRLPYYYERNRAYRIVSVYNALCTKMNELALSSSATDAIRMFDERWPAEAMQITAIKKVDFILWQSRPAGRAQSRASHGAALP
jgi:hypothetical protein